MFYHKRTCWIPGVHLIIKAAKASNIVLTLVCEWNPVARPCIQPKATEQFFPVVLCIMLYKVVLTFECIEEILKCGHSNESHWAVLSCDAVSYTVLGGSNFWVCAWNPNLWMTIKIKSTEQYIPVLVFVMMYKAVLTFDSVDLILSMMLQFSWNLFSTTFTSC